MLSCKKHEKQAYNGEVHIKSQGNTSNAFITRYTV